MCNIQSLHSCNRSHSLNRYKSGERKLCRHSFETSKIPQGSLKQGQTPEKLSARRDCPCMWKNTLPCRHTCSRIISFISLTHTHRLFLLARSTRLGSSLCQHMHTLGLVRSEPTGCLFTEVPHNTAMISLTLSEAQPSMQSIRSSTFPPPSCLLVGLF